MTTTQARTDGGAGGLLRQWRETRRVSQLELSHIAEVSQRHLSWVETGRSAPSRDLILSLAKALDIPLRDQNAILNAGGFASVYGTGEWDDPHFVPVRDAIDYLLRRHEPNPAIVMDRHWGLIDANGAALRMIETFGGPRALEVAGGNAMRLLAHPEGLRAGIENFAELGAHMADRIAREAATYPADAALAELAEELVELIGPVRETPADAPRPMLVASHLVGGPTGDLRISLMSMLTTVGAALDVTLSELTVELFYPMDPASAAVLETLSAESDR